MDTRKIESAALDFFPEHETWDDKATERHSANRESFALGATWAIDNYSINWINPEVELPPVEKDNESADILVFYEYIGVKGGTYTDYGTGWCDMSPVPAEWHIASGPIDKFKVIGWAALNTPDWYNKATK